MILSPADAEGIDLAGALEAVRAVVEDLIAFAESGPWPAPVDPRIDTVSRPVEAITRLVVGGDATAAVFGLATGPASIVAPGREPAFGLPKMTAVLPLVPPHSVLRVGTARAELRAMSMGRVPVCLEVASGADNRVDSVLGAIFDDAPGDAEGRG